MSNPYGEFNGSFWVRRNGQIGIHLEKSTGNLIKGNELVDNGDFGVFVQANGNQIRGNRCVRGGAGILVGVVQSVMTTVWPEGAGLMIYVGMAAVIVLLPRGLFGRA